ncbi:MAG: glycosyltransferase family 4 protein [Bacteroidetes bacterium]|nr:glycosyltransferase family 4 protein [Bacteroidota bacterium]
MNRKILHITPHLGGGVGRVLINYLSKVKPDTFFSHEVACLDYANDNAFNTVKNIGLHLHDKMAGEHQQLLKMIAAADIVLIHWWNHPLLYDFLVRQTLPPARIIFWSHTSGFHSPYVFTEKALNYPDMFVFTTPISYETNEVRSLPDERRKSLRVVWSTGGVEHVKSVKPKEHTGFNIGYIGTVDYCKMHRDFLKINSKIKIPDAKFIVCGGPSEKQIREESKFYGMDNQYTFTGQIDDITNFLSEFDVFGYPLAPYHYGTCDQALAESMASGVVPVVLSNKMERHMVTDGLTGMVAQNEKEYINAIEKLYLNNELRTYLSINAKKYAVKTFSLDTIKQEWEKVFEEILAFPKTIKKWKINLQGTDISAKDIFLESLGNYAESFISYCNSSSKKEKKKYSDKIKQFAESAVWQADSKGTVHHYHSFFSDDVYLSEWSELMRKTN